MKTKSIRLSGQSGFSLVELLVVIAVIAIIAAIAIPNIANITGQASIAKDQRNAQNIASVAAAARAAGYTNAWADEAAVITALTGSNGAGVSVGTAPNVMSFGVSGLSGDDITQAQSYLQYDSSSGGTVLYTPNATNGGTN